MNSKLRYWETEYLPRGSKDLTAIYPDLEDKFPISLDSPPIIGYHIGTKMATGTLRP